jgi:hypothetical protein
MHAFYAGFTNVDNVAARRSHKGLSMLAPYYLRILMEAAIGSYVNKIIHSCTKAASCS